MKKILFLLCVLMLLVSISACSGNSVSEEKPKWSGLNGGSNLQDTPSTEGQRKYDITDYSVSGMQNVTDAKFCARGDKYMIEVDPKETTPTHIVVSTLCPICHDEGGWQLDISEFADCPFGQQTFIWKKEYYCDEWSTHSDMFTYTFDFSLIFTLNS